MDCSSKKRRITAFAVTVIVGLLITRPASAANQIQASVADVSRPVWTAEESYTIFKNNDYDKPVLLTALLSMYKSNPNMSAADAQAKLAAMKQSLNDGLAIRPPVGTLTLDIQNQNFQRLVKLGFTTLTASPDPITKSIGAVGGGVWEYYTKAADEFGNSETQLYSDVKFGNKTSNAPAASFLQKQLTSAQAFSGNAEFVKALQAIGFEDPNTPTATLIQRHPDFADHEVLDLLKQSLGSNGLKVDLQAMVHTQEITSQRLLDLIGIVRSGLVKQNALQLSFKAYLDAQAQRQDSIRDAQAQSQLDVQKIEATRSSFYIVSTLVGFADPKLGRALGGAGSAFLQATDAVNKYRVAMSILDSSKLDASQKMIGSALGGITMAGSMLSVGLQLFSLFGDSGPSPELAQLQQISHMLQQLSQQVADLHKDMQQRFDQVDQRFDRLDSTLNAIYNSLSQQLSYINWTLYQVTADLITIRTTLSDLQSDVRTLEQRINEMISDGFRRDFQDKIGTYIGYRDHAHAILPYGEFFNTAEYFAQWATLHAGDSLELSPPNRPYDDPSVYDQLSGYPLAFNLNYLSSYPAIKFGLPPLFAAPSQVVNPNDWAIATAAFVRLLTEWPDYARQGSFDSDIAAIQNKGDLLRTALISISTTTSKTANYNLFDKLIGHSAPLHPSSYRGTVKQLQDELDRRKADYRITMGNVPTQLQPWGGTSQATSYTLRALRDPSYRIYYVSFGPWSNCIDLSCNLGVTAPPGLNDLLPFGMRNAEQTDARGYVIKFSLGTAYRGQYTVNGVRYLRTAYVIHGYFVPTSATSADYSTIVFSKVLNGPDYRDPGGYDVWTGDQRAWMLLLDAGWRFLVDQWEGTYRNRFAADALDGDCDNAWQGGWTGGCATPEPNIGSWVAYNAYYIEQAVLATLRSHQREFYRSISPEITAVGTLQNLAKGVMGARLALTSFVELGLSQSVGSNEYLRSLLSGPSEFASPATIRNVLDAAISQTDAQSDLMVDFVSISEPWIQQMDGVLQRILSTIDTGQNIEYDAVVENTLARLQTLRDLRKLPLASDVTTNVGVTRGPVVFDSNRSRYTQLVTFQNRTGLAIKGPMAVVLDNLSDSAMLTNADGSTEFTQPAGSVYKTISLVNNTLGGTASTAVTLEFAATSAAIGFVPRVLAGSGLDSPINGPAITVCIYTVMPRVRPIGAAGGAVAFTVDTSASCDWNVGGLPSWAHSTATGSGAGLASINVDPNVGAQRSAIIIVAGQSVTINQDGQSTAVLAQMTSPTNGSALIGSSVMFTWSAGAGASAYWLDVGTVQGQGNIFGQNVGLATSQGVTNISINGSAVYVRLWTQIAGAWQYNDYSYIALH